MDTTIRVIGRTIKELRSRRGLTLEELAEKSGCTPGFISQLERNQAAPSIVTLYAIAEVLGVKVTDFFPDVTNPTKVVRRDERGTFKIEGSAIGYSLLTSKFPHGALQAFILTYLPSNQALPTDEYRAHLGEEFIYILDGELHIRIGDVSYDLLAGDSVYFKSSAKHSLENRIDRPTVVISMITPSIF
ncbi:MAG TPA: helix-turn-helix domain-containing protein [Anaerolineales bacterium]|jgi:transcriptional regulator with XRE-family HTH domain